MNQLPELVTTKTAMHLLGVRDRSSWRKIADANPKLLWRIPGLTRPKVRRCELQKLLPPREE